MNTAKRGLGPASAFTDCVSPTHCRQNHGKPSHGAVECWYRSPTPPYAPGPKLVAAEQGKSLLPGESERWPWGGSAAPGSGSSKVLCVPPLPALPAIRVPGSFLAPGDPKEESLEAQISRLAELIGRLENKVSRTAPALPRGLLPPSLHTHTRAAWPGGSGSPVEASATWHGVGTEGLEWSPGWWWEGRGPQTAALPEPRVREGL